ncbi:9887_t:CDS:2 [Dentiscutata erythropus]|uniref:9887_t:CDS:1 n=1 Tax=Dentiscutata erythropus TaxID=1348616 RepID=A0A9N8WHP8_9GLOM|nr:9887_t:CDS:2 [Dentiscutata erythropus]
MSKLVFFVLALIAIIAMPTFAAPTLTTLPLNTGSGVAGNKPETAGSVETCVTNGNQCDPTVPNPCCNNLVCIGISANGSPAQCVPI